MDRNIENPRVMESSPQDVKPDVATLSLLDGAEQDEESNFLDGNVYLRVENRIFFVHQYKLLKFRKLEEMLRIHDEIVLSGSAIDFLNVLRLLYVSPFDSLTRFNPDTPALISALRVATTYDYHELRIFAINQLELKALPPLEYLPLACEFGIAGWKDKALDHLVSRDEPITEAEAELLGTKVFVAAVVRREQRLAQKNKTLQPQDSTLRLPSDHPHEPVASGHSPAGHSSSDEIPEAPLASNTTLQMNSRGATPLAPDASSDHSRTRSNGISDNLQKGIPGARVLSPVILSTKQVKSWNHAQATQRNQRYGKMRKVSTGSSDEENDEELKRVPHATTSDMVSVMWVYPAHIADIADSYQPASTEQTQMKCKPDSQTIGRWIFPLNKRKQEHQLGIVKNCLFDNTLISLTAGSDKTFIAGCVMLNFYNWFPTGKIVFVAQTEALFTQQIETCHNSCGIPRRDTIELTGINSKARRRRGWEERRILYVTPQVFENDLRDGTCDALDVVLVVIDEAWRATRAHPYARIMHFLMANNPYHRVLALNTTPLKGGKTLQDIVDGLHISRVEIRAHLDIQIVGMNDAINVIKDSLEAVMRSLLETVQATGRLKDAKPETLDPCSPTAEAAEIRSRKCTDGMSVLAHLNHLSNLARALRYLLECSAAMCRQYLVGSYACSRLRCSSSWKGNEWKATLEHIENHRLETVSLGLETKFPPHPKMQKLNELLREHLMPEDAKEARVLVLTSFPLNLDEIAAHINTNGPGIRASTLARRAGRINGYPKEAKTISHFKSGKFNVLVTALIEEVLYIGEIDLVVCYDARCASRDVPKLFGNRRGGRVIVLLAKGQEEKFWYKAQESRQGFIDESTVELFNDAAKITPEEPRCDEKMLEIEPYSREAHGILSGKRSNTELETGTSSKRHCTEHVKRSTPEGALMSS